MNKRPIGVTIFAIFQILAVLKKLVGGVMVLTMQNQTAQPWQIAMTSGMALFQVAIAIGLFKGWAWSHALACVLLTWRALAGLISLSRYPQPILMLAFCAVMLLIVVYLVTNKRVRAFFYGVKETGSQSAPRELIQ